MTLQRTEGGWRYKGVDYHLPLPVNSPVSFAVAKTNTEADGLGPSTARHSTASLQARPKTGGFNNSTRRDRRVKYPEFAHLTEEERKRAIAKLYYHKVGGTTKGVYKGGKYPDLTPLELLEMCGLPMPPVEVRTWPERTGQA